MSVRFVTVEGLKELDAKLSQLKASTAKGVLRRVGREALEPFDAAWRDRAPVLSGRLRDSGGIGSKLTRSARKAHERESAVEIFAGPGPNPEAVQQEFGNARHAPQPFVRPAWAETQDQVLKIVAERLGDEIDKAARNAERRRERAAKRAADEG